VNAGFPERRELYSYESNGLRGMTYGGDGVREKISREGLLTRVDYANGIRLQERWNAACLEKNCGEMGAERTILEHGPNLGLTVGMLVLGGLHRIDCYEPAPGPSYFSKP
jgi:hypothetical protein